MATATQFAAVEVATSRATLDGFLQRSTRPEPGGVPCDRSDNCIPRILRHV